MELIYYLLCFFLFVFSLALLSNKARSRKKIEFELQPNCLLTRWPLLFVSGPRSLFYFSSYWNLYTSYLAEHGYEVYNLHLPWSDSVARKKHFVRFFEEQEKTQQRFHLVIDQATKKEFANLLQGPIPNSIISVTEISNETSQKSLNRGSWFLKLAYQFHSWKLGLPDLPSLSTLGALPETALANCHLLLGRVKTLAEKDFTGEIQSSEKSLHTK